MNEDSDEDLLIMTSFQNENEEEAKEAFKIFYDRHKQYLWNLCCKVCRDIDMANDVMQNTWIAIYKYSHTYNANKSSVKTWMSKIANNEMIDLLKKETSFIHLNEDVYSIPDVDDAEEITPSLEKREVDKALNLLSDKEKDILLTYMQYSDGNKHLPDEVISELCRRYSTLPANLRQIKKRSLNKVKDHINSNKSVTINKKHQ
jgi:RNA polymerase sigma factor (sigma-70 family)